MQSHTEFPGGPATRRGRGTAEERGNVRSGRMCCTERTACPGRQVLASERRKTPLAAEDEKWTRLSPLPANACAQTAARAGTFSPPGAAITHTHARTAAFLRVAKACEPICHLRCLFTRAAGKRGCRAFFVSMTAQQRIPELDVFARPDGSSR